MAWTREQQERLKVEKTILQHYFPGFEWKDPTGNTRVEGWMNSNKGNQYSVRLYVPLDTPNSVPPAVVLKPYPLYDSWGKKLYDYGPSHSMHLLSPIDGYAQICHHRQSSWTPAITFYKVLVKVRVWIEAYEGHKLTGNPISHYVRNQ